MYDLILNELYRLNNVDSDEAKAQYLQSLQPAALRLFHAYRGTFVRVDYRDKNVQAAYMIRYFPQYSQIIRLILNDPPRNYLRPFNQRDLSACFFGSGPAPEVIGLLQFLATRFPNIRAVKAHAFDIIAEEWAYARDITRSLALSIWHDRQLELKGNAFDLSQAGAVEQCSNIIASSKLLVFQNCLNEVRQDQYLNVAANLVSLVQAMASGSILIIIDLSNYQPALNLIQRIETLIKDRQLASVLANLSQRRYDAQEMIGAMPQIIRTNLLTGIPFQVENGLIPRRYIDYHYFVVRKD